MPSTSSLVPRPGVLADARPTPAGLLDLVAAARVVADRAEAAVLQLAVQWAHAHPVLPGDESWRISRVTEFVPGEFDASVSGLDATEAEMEWCGICGIPPVRADAPAAFAAANNMATTAGTCLIRDALILAHRLPRTWARVVSGQAPAWRARKVAEAVIGAPADVVAYVDAQVESVIHQAGAVTIAKLLDEAMLRLHAEEREIKQLEDLDKRFVDLDERTINGSGIAELHARGDWKDLHDLDQTLTRLAAALKVSGVDGCEDSLDVRRSIALGMLSDPAAAQALLDGQADQPSARPKKSITLFLHLTDQAILGRDTVGRNEATGSPVLAEAIRAWCGRTDTHLRVQPVIDLNDHVDVNAYEIPERLHTRINLIHPTCVFPWCTQPARRCDHDHVTAYAAGGSTCTCNLAPLCRSHHRLKTHTGWTYRPPHQPRDVPLDRPPRPHLPPTTHRHHVAPRRSAARPRRVEALDESCGLPPRDSFAGSCRDVGAPEPCRRTPPDSGISVMSVSAAQADAFYREALAQGTVWTVEDSGGIPAPQTREGRAMPFWSKESRARQIITHVPAYAGFTPLAVPLPEFRERWLPDLQGDGLLVGLNWSGARAVGYDLSPADLERNLAAREKGADG